MQTKIVEKNGSNGSGPWFLLHLEPSDIDRMLAGEAIVLPMDIETNHAVPVVITAGRHHAEAIEWRNATLGVLLTEPVGFSDRGYFAIDILNRDAADVFFDA